MEENPKKTNRVISKEEYYKLRAYQNVHNSLMDILTQIEIDSLEVTQEIDYSDDKGRFLLGGITSDILNHNSEEALNDGLKALNISVEKDKVFEVVKSVSKVSKKKKKDSFKSGRWQKDNKLNKIVEVKDEPFLHYWNDEFINNEKRILSQEELDEIMNIGVEEEDVEDAPVRVDRDILSENFDDADDIEDVDIFGDAKG